MEIYRGDTSPLTPEEQIISADKALQGFKTPGSLWEIVIFEYQRELRLMEDGNQDPNLIKSAQSFKSVLDNAFGVHTQKVFQGLKEECKRRLLDIA